MVNLSKIVERLKDLMQESEITISELSEKINLDSSEISKFLRNERMPSTPTLVKLADFFHCTTDYILGYSDILDERTFKKRPPFNEQLKFLLDYFHKTRYRLIKEAHFAEFTVTKWYKGRYEPTPESLIRLAKYFKCSVDFVLGREV